MVEHLNVMIIGALIVFFLIVEPHGLARLWRLIREKLIALALPALRAAAQDQEPNQPNGRTDDETLYETGRRGGRAAA